MQNNFKCSRRRQFSHDLFAPSALKPGIEIQKRGVGGANYLLARLFLKLFILKILFNQDLEELFSF